MKSPAVVASRSLRWSRTWWRPEPCVLSTSFPLAWTRSRGYISSVLLQGRMASRDAFGMSNSDNNNAENSSGGDNASGGRRSSLAGGSQPLRPASDPTARMRTLFYGILIFSLGMSAAFFAHAVYTMKRMQHIQEDILTDNFKVSLCAIQLLTLGHRTRV